MVWIDVCERSYGSTGGCIEHGPGVPGRQLGLQSPQLPRRVPRQHPPVDHEQQYRVPRCPQFSPIEKASSGVTGGAEAEPVLPERSGLRKICQGCSLQVIVIPVDSLAFKCMHHFRDTAPQSRRATSLEWRGWLMASSLHCLRSWGAWPPDIGIRHADLSTKDRSACFHSNKQFGLFQQPCRF